MEFDSHFGQETALAWTVIQTGHREPAERGLLNLPKGEMIFRGS